MKKILIVGAGAVGQVYGYQFAQAGHQVSFFVKEKYRPSLEKGLTLYNLNSDKKKTKPITFSNFDTLSSWEDVKSSGEQQSWDQVYLCISSTALLNYDFDAMKAAVGEQTTIILLQPGPNDYALATQHINADRIIQGMITLISYDAPLTGESVPTPGIAYWLPPLTATPFSGESTRLKDVIATFKSAGMAATSNPDLREEAPYPTALLMTFLTALEANDWNFDQLKANKKIQQQMITAQRQAFNTIAKDNNKRPPIWNNWLKPWMVRVAIRFAPKALPMDIETYFQFHFTKVKDQTKLFMQNYIESATKNGLPVSELATLNKLTD